MNASPAAQLDQTVAQGYRLLEPAQKYTRAFCTDDEIEIAEHIRNYVTKELMPYRHDIEGGWHRDEQLAKDTLPRIEQLFVEAGAEQSGDAFTLALFLARRRSEQHTFLVSANRESSSACRRCGRGYVRPGRYTAA